MQIIGHRGSPETKPENTLASFDKALFDGATAVEIDVRKCRDGLVVIHDSTVDRTTNGKGRVKRMTVEQLQQLDAGDGEVIPTVEEVFEHLSGKCQIFVEIKGRQIAHDVAGLITQKVLEDKLKYDDVVVICFYPDVLERVKELNSEIQIGVHIEEGLGGGDKEMLYFSKATMEVDIKSAIKQVNPEYLLPCVNVVSKEMVDIAHKQGVKVATWTVKSQEDVKIAVDSSVDAIITDNPAMVK